jgi:photosystem II stability/assembly factor-like uncharacterized protein
MFYLDSSINLVSFTCDASGKNIYGIPYIYQYGFSQLLPVNGVSRNNNYGSETSWITTTFPDISFGLIDLACDSTGQNVFVVANTTGNTPNGSIYRSTNYGVSFENLSDLSTTYPAPRKQWTSITCDSSGQHLVASVFNGNIESDVFGNIVSDISLIYYSVDSGTNWNLSTIIDYTPVPNSSTHVQTISGDLTHIVDTTIYNSSSRFQNTGSSSDGNIVYALLNQSYSKTTTVTDTIQGVGQDPIITQMQEFHLDLYKSINYGANFEKIIAPVDNSYASIMNVACDSTGQNIIASVLNIGPIINNGGAPDQIPYGIYRSTNGGATWHLTGADITEGQLYYSLSSDATGSYLAAFDNSGGRIYISNGDDQIWTVQDISGGGDFFSMNGPSSLIKVSSDAQRAYFSPYSGGFYSNVYTPGSPGPVDTLSIVLQGNSSSYLSIPNVSILKFGTGDFTIQWYQYQTDTHSHPRVFSIGNYPTQTIGVSIEGGAFYYWNTGANYIANLNTDGYKNKWIHFAISRTNSITYIFKNGVCLNPSGLSDSTNFQSSLDLTIGNETSRSDQSAFGGYIYQFNWYKGTGFYDALGFSSPTIPSTSDSNNILLLYGNNYLGTLGTTVNANNITTSTDLPNIRFGPPPAPWIQETASYDFDKVICDETGQYMTALTYDPNENKAVYVSRDYGVTWDESFIVANTNLTDIACDSSGQNIVLATSSGKIYRSTNYGDSFQILTNSPTADWNAITSNSTGQYLIAGQVNGDQAIYYSNNYGASWTQSTVAQNTWIQVLSNTTGQYVYAYGTNNDASGYLLYRSDDFGASFANLGSLGYQTRGASITLTYMTCDSTGQNVVVGTGSNGIFRSTDYGVSWTSNSIAPIDANQNYNTVSSDKTGQYLVASDYNNKYVYASTNYGETWNQQGTPNTNVGGNFKVLITPDSNYMYVMIVSQGFYINTSPPSPPAEWIRETENNYYTRFVCDSSGRFIAGVYYGTIYTSFDYGQHWSSGRDDFDYINDIACDSTGKYIVLATNNSEVLYRSTNYGKTFSEIIMPVSSGWLSITSDASGHNLVAGQYGSDMYYSTDSGTTWTQSNVESPLPTRFTSVVSSYNGEHVIAAGFNDDTSDTTIYTSADYGANFTNWNPISSGVIINQLACDSTGQYVVAAATTSGVYRSTNYGVSWTLTSAHIPNHDYRNIASDATGQYLVVADSINHITYISEDNGTTWVLQNTPGTNISSENNTAVRISSDGQYAYSTTINVGFYINQSPPPPAPQEPWFLETSTYSTAIACDASGKLIATINMNNFGENIAVNISTDYGLTWSKTDISSALFLTDIACTANGQIIYLTLVENSQEDNYIYKSTDYGRTFSPLPNPNIPYWFSITCDSTGQNVVAGEFSIYSGLVNQIYYSRDSGATWNESNIDITENYCYGLASSSNGQYVYASATLQYNSNICTFLAYSSIDYGANFSSILSFNITIDPRSGDNSYLFKIACSSNGEYVFAAVGTQGVYVSADYGSTWNPTNADTNSSQIYDSISCDSTGQYVVAADSNNHYTYVSSDYGDTWTLQNTPGSENGSNINIFDNIDVPLIILYPNVVKMTSDAQYMYSSTQNVGFYINQLPPDPLSVIRPWIQESRYASHSFYKYVSDETGRYLTGIQYNNGNNTIYVSADYGVSWTQTYTNPSLQMNDIACDNTGQYIVLATSPIIGNNGRIYGSTDYGQTFQILPDSPSARWSTITSDSTGDYLVAGQSSNNQEMYYSENGGQSWNQSYVENNDWNILTSSKSGQYVYAVGSVIDDYGYKLYISNNYGSNFYPNGSSIGNQFGITINIQDITCDSTGQYVAVAAGTAGVYLSTNYGDYWTKANLDTSNSEDYRNISCDASGQYLVVGDGNRGYTYASSTYGNTWIQQDLSGSIDHIDGSNKVKITPNGDFMYSMVDNVGFYINRQPPSILPSRNPGEIYNDSQFFQDLADDTVQNMRILENIFILPTDPTITAKTVKIITTPNATPVNFIRPQV